MLRSLVHQNQHVLVGEAVSVAKEKKIITNGGGGAGVHAQTCSTLTEGCRRLLIARMLVVGRVRRPIYTESSWLMGVTGGRRLGRDQVPGY